MLKAPLPVRKAVTIDGLMGIADRAQSTLTSLRDDLLAPWPRKHAPTMTGTRLAGLCNLDRVQLNHLCQKGKIPPGSFEGKGRNRKFSLIEAQTIFRQIGPYRPRPEGVDGFVLSVGNFKGGVGKTTTAIALAQGLTLRGHKVCLIDLDPQASTTTLCGYVPDAEITDEMTVLPVVYGEQDTLAYAPVESYWSNIDLIPASPSLFGADYFLPNKQSLDPSFEFWKVLDNAMKPLREKYDVIVIDTPPTLSYLAIGAFMATDGMLVPLPPETLDYASSTQYFRQFSELFSTMRRHKSIGKEFDFVSIVLSKVKASAATTEAVKTWITQTYPDLVNQHEIPETDLVKNASAVFKTIYDLSNYDGSAKTFQRALDAFDAVVTEVEGKIQSAWLHKAAALPSSSIKAEEATV